MKSILVLALIAIAPVCNADQESGRAELKKMKISYSRKAFLESVEQGKADAVKLFIEAGMSPAAEKGDKDFPLDIAAVKGHTEIIGVLLKAGADINAQDKYGNTALKSAAYNGYHEAVKALLSAGADLEIKNNDGRTALCGISHVYKTRAKADHVDIVKTLVSAGAVAGCEKSTSAYRPVLEDAILFSSEDIAVALIEAGMDIKTGNPLYQAAKEGKPKVVKALLSAGADPNIKDIAKKKIEEESKLYIGKTVDKCSSCDWPLIGAVNGGVTEIVKLLVQSGAELIVEDYRGNSPISIAFKKGYKDMIPLLFPQDTWQTEPKKWLDYLAAAKVDGELFSMSSYFMDETETKDNTLYYWCAYFDKNILELKDYCPLVAADKFQMEAGLTGTDRSSALNQIKDALMRFTPVVPEKEMLEPKQVRAKHYYFYKGIMAEKDGDAGKRDENFKKTARMEPKFYSVYAAWQSCYNKKHTKYSKNAGEIIKTWLADSGGWSYEGIDFAKEISKLKTEVAKKQFEAKNKFSGDEDRAVVIAMDGTGDFDKFSDIREGMLPPGSKVIVRPGKYSWAKLAGGVTYSAQGEVIVNDMSVRDVKNTEISGFIIKPGAAHSAGLIIENSQNIAVSGCEIMNYNDIDSKYAVDEPAGISIKESQKISVRNNKIKNNTVGIRIVKSGEVVLEHNLIADSVAGKGKDVRGGRGVLISGSIKTTLKNNTIAGNNVDGVYVDELEKNKSEVFLIANIFASNCGKSDKIFCGGVYDYGASNSRRNVEYVKEYKNNVFFNNGEFYNISPHEVIVDPKRSEYYSKQLAQAYIDAGLNNAALGVPSEMKSYAKFCARELGMIFKNNFKIDPGFVDEKNGDYRLKEDSLAAGKGEGGAYAGAFPPAGQEKPAADVPKDGKTQTSAPSEFR